MAFFHVPMGRMTGVLSPGRWYQEATETLSTPEAQLLPTSMRTWAFLFAASNKEGAEGGD
jgi:hypothetical protein